MKNNRIRRTLVQLSIAASSLFFSDFSTAQRPEMPVEYGGDAHAIVRVFSPDAEFDFAVSGANNDIRLIQKYSRNSDKSVAPSLVGAYFRLGLEWRDWQEKYQGEAKTLKGLLKRGETFTRVAFNKDKTLVALARAVDGDLVATEVVVLAWPDLKSILQKKLTESRFIDDLAWQSGSPSLFVLQRTERTGLWPWELLAAVAGHPIPHNSLYLARLDVPTAILSEAQTPLLRNVTYAYGWLFLRGQLMRPNESLEPTR